MLEMISIPTGTIKRFNADFDYCKNYIFQFLLVRLKVRVLLTISRSPYNFNSYWYD